MNCCFIIILLLLCGKGQASCDKSSNCCGSSCIQPRRSASKVCDDNDCQRTQTVITKTEREKDSCPCNMNMAMATENFGPSRYSMYNMKDEDCGCRN